MRFVNTIWIQGVFIFALLLGTLQLQAQCVITPQITVNDCDVNGTPYDPTDDFYTITVTASAVMPGASGQFNVTRGADVFGPFNYGTVQTITGFVPDSTEYTLVFTDADLGSACSNTITGISKTPCCKVNVTTVSTHPEVMSSALGAEGKIFLCINSGVPPYTITTTPSTTAAIYQVPGDCTHNYVISGLAAANYNVSVVDAQGCNTTLSDVAVGGNTCSDILIASAGGGTTSCHNSTDGKITVSIFDKGNATSLTVDPGNGLPTQTFTNLDEDIELTNIPPGEYNLAFFDNLGCQITYLFNSVTVTSPTDSVGMNVTTSNETAVGAADGQIDVCGTGSNGGYTYSISPQVGVVDSTGSACGGIIFDSLSTGIYTVTTTDANGCQDALTVVISNPDCALQATNVSTVDNICGGQNGGEIHFGITGGTAPYEVSFDGGQTYTSTHNTDSIQLTGLKSNIYDIVIKDSNNCLLGINSHTIIKDLNEPIVLDPTRYHATTHGGNNGKIELCVNGGVEPYTLAVAGQAGPFTAQGGNGDCAETFIVENLPAGTYNLTITDNLGCEKTIQVEILEPSCSSFQNVSHNMTSEITCFNLKNGFLQINIGDGQAPYQINIPGVQSVSAATNSYTFTGMDAGVYEVFVTDAAGCFVPLVVEFEIQEPHPLSTLPSSTPACAGQSNGSICLTPQEGTPAYTYNMKDSDKNDVTVHTGAGDCGGEFHATNLEAGAYHIELIDSKGCKAHGMTEVSEVSVSIAGDITNDCSTLDIGAIENVAGGGGTAPYTYQWASGSNATSLTNLSNDSYTVTATDSRGCTGQQTFEVELQDVTIQSASTPTCAEVNKGEFTAAISNGEPQYSWSWSGQGQANTGTGSSVAASNLAIGTYTIAATDSRGCQATSSVNVEEYDMIANLTPQSTCQGQNNGFISATSSVGVPNFTYLWSNSATTATAENLAVGTYTVTITDANGCTAVGSSNVEEYMLNPTFTVQNVCAGSNTGSIAVNVENTTGTVSYNWSNQLNTNPLQNIGAGSYTVTVTDALGCTTTGTATVSEFDSPTVNAGEDVSIITGNSTTLTASASGGGNPYVYVWQPAGGNANNETYLVSPTTTTTYTVQVTDANGCTGTDEVVVKVLPQVVVQMPNAFSPNGDGNNDVFEPYIPSGSVPLETFQIYDRWGVLVHNDPSSAWDGMYNGAKQPVGTYVYVVEYNNTLGEKQTKKGHFSLIR